jgi:16S rRNA (uracil1498-N3)-methyltransferase
VADDPAAGAGRGERRFFVPAGSLRARNVTLGGEMAFRLARVLRLRRGDHVILTEGGPREYDVQLTSVLPHAVTGVVKGDRTSPAEASVQVALYQALIRPNRFDLVLEKGTEVGVARFVPVIAARSRLQMEEASAGRSERWARVIMEAAEQCGRGHLPVVEAPLTFERAVAAAPGLKLLPYEGERLQRLGPYLRAIHERPQAVSLFIGPEGGFEDSEVALAREAGVVTVTLGRRVMRAETAAIVAAAIVLHELDL